jgi:Phorbol esters/diacylglycerol binding domain (C1 domain)
VPEPSPKPKPVPVRRRGPAHSDSSDSSDTESGEEQGDSAVAESIAAAGSHVWKQHTYMTLTDCDICHKLLRGLHHQGLRCGTCNKDVHEKCATSVGACGATEERKSSENTPAAAPAPSAEKSPSSGKKDASSSKKDASSSKAAPQQRQVEAPKTGSTSNHKWKKHNYKKPTDCDACGHMLVGLMHQGSQCESCGQNSHSKCIAEFPHACNDDQSRNVSGKSAASDTSPSAAAETPDSSEKSAGFLSTPTSTSTSSKHDVSPSDSDESADPSGRSIPSPRPGIDLEEGTAPLSPSDSDETDDPSGVANESPSAPAREGVDLEEAEAQLSPTDSDETDETSGGAAKESPSPSPRLGLDGGDTKAQLSPSDSDETEDLATSEVEISAEEHGKAPAVDTIAVEQPEKTPTKAHKKHKSKKKHEWETHTYKKPTYCAVCEKMLKGLIHQGVRCRRCRLDVHDSCQSEVKQSCHHKAKSSTPAAAAECEHEFSKHSYHSPTSCDSCHKMLLGLRNQGYQCSKCKRDVHKDCRGEGKS